MTRYCQRTASGLRLLTSAGIVVALIILGSQHVLAALTLPTPAGSIAVVPGAFPGCCTPTVLGYTPVPATGPLHVGDVFLASVVVTGQPENFIPDPRGTGGFIDAEGTLTLSPNLRVLDIRGGTCESGPSLPGPLLASGTSGEFDVTGTVPSTNLSCTAGVMIIQVVAPGQGTITITNASEIGLLNEGASSAPPPGGCAVGFPFIIFPQTLFVCAFNELKTVTNGTFTLLPAQQTGTISFFPFSGTHRVGETFQTSLYLSGNGQPITGASASVTIPNFNLTVLNILPGDCGVTVTTLSFNVTLPAPSNPAIARLTQCRLYTLVLQASGNRANAPADVSITNAHILALDGTDILKATMDAVFTLTP